jgi:hypothetical protein
MAENELEPSKRFALNNADLKKIGKGAIIAVLGALLTYGTEYFAKVDYGIYGPAFAALWAVFVNVAWKYLKDNSSEPTTSSIKSTRR